MATNRDNPVGGNQDQPPKIFDETVRDVRRGVSEDDRSISIIRHSKQE